MASSSSTTPANSVVAPEPDTGLARTATHPDKAAFDPNLDPNLPYRTISTTANVDEYRLEAPCGSIPAAGGSAHKLVVFTPGDPENPKNWSKAYKWYCTMVVAATCFVVAFCSSVITADVPGVAEQFDVSEEVALLTISLFVVGFGVGPMVFAPLSEIYGRRVI
jgi:hypothetical protein